MFKKDILKKNEKIFTVIFFKNEKRILTTNGNLTRIAEHIQGQAHLPGARGTITVAIVPENVGNDISLLTRERDFNAAYYDKAPGVYVHVSGGTRFIKSEDLAGYAVANYGHDHTLVFLGKDGDWLEQPSFQEHDDLITWINSLVLYPTATEAFEAAKALWKDLPGAYHVAISVWEGKVK